MKLWELMKFSFLNLWRRKLRTSLTVMGVMIGTASIVVMVSLGIGLNHATMEQIEKSSTLTLITVNNYGGGMMKANGGFQEEQKSVSITVDSVAEMAALEHVKSASPVYDFNVIAKSGKYEASFQIQAMSLNMLRSLNLPILKGSLPQEGDSLKLIAGQSIGSYFYDPKSNGAMMGGGMDSASKPPVDMFDSSIYIIYDSNAYYNSQSGDPQFKAPKKYLADVSTLLGMAQTGDEYNYSPFDYQVFADFEAVKTQFQHMFKKAAWPNQQVDKKGKPIIPMTFNMAYVLVDDVNNVLAVQEVLKGMGYQANSELEFVKSMQESSKLMQYVLAGIGGVSLLVAAIGIANTMLMSIFERTKEIGIFKVLGCSLPNIRGMFLTEAGLIGLCGGALGVTLSYALSYVINKLVGMGEISLIPFWLAAFGLGFAVLVGMASGFYPARRAMKLSPLEAIRTL